MKKVLLVICLSLAVVMLATPAPAKELWFYHCVGTNEGLAAGCLFPPAKCGDFINNSFFAFNHVAHDDLGNAIPERKDFRLRGYSSPLGGSLGENFWALMTVWPLFRRSITQT